MGNMCSIKRTKVENPKKRNFKEKCNSAVETLRKSLKIKSKKYSTEHLSAIIENKETEENTNENNDKVEEESKETKETVQKTEENAVNSDENIDNDIIVHSQMSRDSSIITAVYVEDKLIEFGEEEKEETTLIKDYLNNYREMENNMEEPKPEIELNLFVNDLLEIQPDNFNEISVENIVSNENEIKTEDISEETKEVISHNENISQNEENIRQNEENISQNEENIRQNEENTESTEIIQENEYANDEVKNTNLIENEEKTDKEEE